MIAVRDLSKLYVLKNLILLEGKLYEKLSQKYPTKYRVILSDDDYDYVADLKLTSKLNIAFRTLETR